MRTYLRQKEAALIAQVPTASWQKELEQSTMKYHTAAAWAAIIFDPIFAFTDYINIPESWSYVLVIRLCVSAVTLATLFLSKRYHLPANSIVIVPFLLISLQNAYTYSLIGDEDILGHNLNYMALLIGAGLFVAWSIRYSLVLIILSTIATGFFIHLNPSLALDEFFLKGGLILMASAIFMAMLIQTRHNLTVKEIKARLALQLSNEEIRLQNEEIKAQNQEIQAQGEEIRGINENLEGIVRSRTAELEKKNQALEEYAFINAHKLRSPVASILGLINLMNKVPLNEEGRNIQEHLQISADRLDEIVSSITKAIERGDKA
jgi:signal transduction histidine kinase